MAALPDTEQVRRMLAPKLGQSLARAVAPAAAQALEGCSPRRTPPDTAAARIETALFRALYRELGVSMIFTDDAGIRRRISTDDLPELTDCVMAALFASMQPDAAAYDILHDYAMRTGSFAAMSELYRRYADYCGSEHAVIGQILRGRCGPELPDWLKMPG